MKLTVTFALVLLVSILTVVVTASHHPSITDNDRSYTRVRLTVTESLIQQFMQARLKAAGDHSIVYNLTATSDPKITEGFQTALLEYFDGRVLQSAHRNDDGSIGRDEPCRSLRDNCHVRTYNISHQVRVRELLFVFFFFLNTTNNKIASPRNIQHITNHNAQQRNTTTQRNTTNTHNITTQPKNLKKISLHNTTQHDTKTTNNTLHLN